MNLDVYVGCELLSAIGLATADARNVARERATYPAPTVPVKAEAAR